MKKSKVTDKMTTLMNNIPMELRKYFNVVENDNKVNDLKSLFGLLYSTGNCHNTNIVTIARSRVIEAFGKSINSVDLNNLISRLKDMKLLEKVGMSQNGTSYKLLFLPSSTSETSDSETATVEKRNIPMNDSNNSNVMEVILSELKKMNEKIDNLSKENSELKREISELKGEISSLKNSNTPTHHNGNTTEEDPRNAGNAPIIEVRGLDEEMYYQEVEMPSEAITEPSANIIIETIQDSTANPQNDDMIPEHLKDVKEEYYKGMKKINWLGKGIFVKPPMLTIEVKTKSSMSESEIKESINKFNPVDFETNPRIIRDNSEFQSIEFCEAMIDRCEREWFNCENLKLHLAKLQNKEVETVSATSSNDEWVEELPF